MKVISLTEPYATLIKEKKKKIETRGWKTEYRGELYIHASSTRIPKDWQENSNLMKIVDDKLFNFGNIICKCNLVDCIYMTKEFIEKIKKDNNVEYLCGVYEEGRYAWILEDIEVLNMPIKAKGQLNIWNYYDEYEIMNQMSMIKYGWVYKDELKEKVDNTFSDNYSLQSPQDIIRNKVGICWDQTELERYYFKPTNYNIKTFFIVHYDDNCCPTHTFLTYEKDNKYYWFEHSWKKFLGIHEYNTITNLLKDVKKKFIENELKGKFEPNNLVIYEYTKPKYHISVQEFYKHCENGKMIIV